MSAFFLLAPPPAPKDKRRSSKTSSNSGRISHRSARRSDSGLAKSIMAANIGSDKKPKKLFDPKKLQYVDAEELMTPFEKKLHFFEEKLLGFKKSDKFAEYTESLNSSFRESKHLGKYTPLMTLDALTHMRYCYFEQFEPELLEVQARLAHSTPPYVELVLYNERLARYTTDSRTKSMSQRHSVSASPQSRNSSQGRNNSISTYSPLGRDTRPDLLLRLSDEFILNTSAIRLLLLQPLFWNDVYLDMKVATNPEHYDWLPNRDVAQNFMIDLMDVAFSHVHCFSCDVEDTPDLNQDEIFELKKQQYFYFGVQGQKDLATLNLHLHETFVVNMTHVPIGLKEAEVCTVVKELCQCVCDNLLIQYYGRRQAEYILEHFGEYIGVIADIMIRTTNYEETIVNETPQTREQKNRRFKSEKLMSNRLVSTSDRSPRSIKQLDTNVGDKSAKDRSGLDRVDRNYRIEESYKPDKSDKPDRSYSPTTQGPRLFPDTSSLESQLTSIFDPQHCESSYPALTHTQPVQLEEPKKQKKSFFGFGKLKRLVR